ncbi:MAG TPA: amidohydrolase, partial [Chitinophagaceae bacterium]|nr:amidohydrolase [Chitinophagaceae bacterium]
MAFSQQNVSLNKQAVLRSIQKHEQALIGLSDQVWGFAEIAMREHQSAKVLADYAEKQGFRVTKNIAEIPTAFIA